MAIPQVSIGLPGSLSLDSIEHLSLQVEIRPPLARVAAHLGARIRAYLSIVLPKLMAYCARLMQITYSSSIQMDQRKREREREIKFKKEERP